MTVATSISEGLFNYSPLTDGSEETTSIISAESTSNSAVRIRNQNDMKERAEMD